jgi:outer membrane protein TolC
LERGLQLTQAILDRRQVHARRLRQGGAAARSAVAQGLEVGLEGRNILLQRVELALERRDRLLNLINVPDFEVRVGPVAFDDYRGGVPTFANSYKLAREYYPQTLSTEESIKQLQIDLETARRNQLPDLDLLASLGYTARATSAGYQQAIANLPNDHGNNWSIGLNYSMPWGRHAEKARYRTALTNLNSRKMQLDQLEQSLLVSVRTAVRAVESSLASVEIAAKGTELAARQYDHQKARFDAGLSTSRQVLLVQDDLEVPTATFTFDPEWPGPRPIILQDHGHPVRFRNVWVDPS